MKKKVAMILAGCGVYDGSEVFESVLSCLYIEEYGAEYEAFAPNIQQHHVVNHHNGEETSESRNVLEESSRIVRGNIKDISELNPNDFDALIIPGGFGVAKNLSDFAMKGAKMTVQAQILAVTKAFAKAKKPIGLFCIAPTLAQSIFENTTEITIGNDNETSIALQTMGAKHIECDMYEAYIDEKNKLVTTPAFMLATRVSEAAPGIQLSVNSVLDLCE